MRWSGAAVVVVVVSCGDSAGPGDPIPASLAATWEASPACVPVGCGLTIARVANPADSLNTTAVTGLTTEITIARSGSFSLLTRPAGPSGTGTARTQGSALIVTDAGGQVDTIDYTLRGEFLDLRFRRTFERDFGDGVMTEASLRGTFRRR